jgi:hypothetical protein
MTFAASSALATTSGIRINAVPRTVATKHVGRLAPSGFRSDATATIIFVTALQRFTLDPSLNIHTAVVPQVTSMESIGILALGLGLQ